MMQPPTKPGIYICEIRFPYPCILEWTGEYWCYPGNYIDIAQKYNEHVTKWQEMPTIKERWTNEPTDKALCVVQLVGTKNEDHGFALAYYDAPNMTFSFAVGYDSHGFVDYYDDWQFVGFAEIG